MTEFKGNILLIGFGAVGQTTLPLILKHLPVTPKRISVIDFVDKRKLLAPWISQGLRFYRERLTVQNFTRVLSRYVQPGDAIIDLAWNI
ncbi:MAG: saccharopine dehydrogenase NADP-binding domain-containing protein, partial [Candidatus Omnitrophica bacterium]|nr:saccharopine dehydrogenase NADP-binding domain-containing protein [Candidatus Omnitrophota bacterium]